MSLPRTRAAARNARRAATNSVCPGTARATARSFHGVPGGRCRVFHATAGYLAGAPLPGGSAAFTGPWREEARMTELVTHLYDDYEQARRAVEALEAAGFPSADISLLSPQVEAADSAE